MSDLAINDYATGFVIAARRIAAIADEAAELVAADKIDSAYLMLGVSRGRMAELAETMNELHKQLGEAGADWRKPLGRHSSDSA